MTNITLLAWLSFTLTTNWGPVEPSYQVTQPYGVQTNYAVVTTNYTQLGTVWSNQTLRFTYHGQEREVKLRSTCIADIGRSAEPWRFGDVWVRPTFPNITLVPPKRIVPDGYIVKSNLLKRLEKLLEDK